MSSIDTLRTSGNRPEEPISVSPDPVLQTTRPGEQGVLAADLLVRSLSKFSQGVGNLYEQTKARTKARQVREAALLAELDKGLPEGYYEEGVQEYNTTRGHMQGRAISNILKVAESNLVQKVEAMGGDSHTKMLNYMSLLDGIVDTKQKEVTGNTPEFQKAMFDDIKATRENLEVNYIKKINAEFETEQKTTLRTLFDGLITNRKFTRALNKNTDKSIILEDNQGNVIDRDKQIPLVTLSDYKEFIRSGLRTTKFDKEQLRGIWLERAIEIATMGADSEGEPIPEVLDHIFKADASGYKLIFDGEFGKAAQAGLIQAKENYISFHTSKDKVAAKELKFQQEKTARDLLSKMIDSFNDPSRYADHSANIADLGGSGLISLSQMVTLQSANKGFTKEAWTPDHNKFNDLMEKVHTFDSSVTMQSLHDEFNAAVETGSGINPEQFAKLTSTFSTLRSEGSSAYRKAVSWQRKNLGKLLKDPEIIKIPGNAELNLARTVGAYNELTTIMSDTYTKLLDLEKLNPSSREFMAKWNEVINKEVLRLSKDEKYKPTAPVITIPPSKKRRGALDIITGWFGSDDKKGEE